MLEWWVKNFANCELGDERLNNRAFMVGKTLSECLILPLCLIIVKIRFSKVASKICRITLWLHLIYRIDTIHLPFADFLNANEIH